MRACLCCGEHERVGLAGRLPRVRASTGEGRSLLGGGRRAVGVLERVAAPGARASGRVVVVVYISVVRAGHCGRRRNGWLWGPLKTVAVAVPPRRGTGSTRP